MTAELPLNAPQRYKLTLDDFALLNGAGAFAGYAKTELIDGRVFGLNAQHRPHARAKDELAYRLRRALEASGNALSVLTEVTVAMPPNDAPQPDILLTSEAEGDGPVPIGSVALIVEVADTTLDFDLGPKAALYAAAGVPEYWIVDLNERRCLLHMGAGADGYAEQLDVPFGETIISGTIEGLEASTSGLA
ncbi:MAG TPA: Uma2 family endonuclease [Allosphingosinicella sp.]|jgi:Uma2 family endonuclease|uniref:Uma2 family endonuclease n=1 Tax=Allosphingosinicella sp. TaxID=2823234 RepID=UPI002F29A69A